MQTCHTDAYPGLAAHIICLEYCIHGWEAAQSASRAESGARIQVKRAGMRPHATNPPSTGSAKEEGPWYLGPVSLAHVVSSIVSEKPYIRRQSGTISSSVFHMHKCAHTHTHPFP